MSLIKFVYIPCVEKRVQASYIANAFEKTGIAMIKKVAIEPQKKKRFNKGKYNRVYIEIDEWCDTESAYNFIQKLKNTSIETRFIHKMDKWWIVRPCEKIYKTKIATNKRKIFSFGCVKEEDNDVVSFDNYMREAYESMQLELASNVSDSKQNTENMDDTFEKYLEELYVETNSLSGIPEYFDWNVQKEMYDWEVLNECLLYA